MKRSLTAALAACIPACLALPACGSIRNYLDPTGPAYAGGSVPPEPTAPDSIRIVTYNVKFGRNVRKAIRELRGAPGVMNADIILLQEMDAVGVRMIADSLGLQYLYYPASVHRSHGKDFGNAILSRWPITEPLKIVLPYERPLGDQRRIAAAATIEAGGLRIRVVSIHTETFWMSRRKRIEQADSMLQALSADCDHVIVGGDFNTPFRSSVEELSELFAGRSFVRVTEGAGWTAKVLPLGLYKVELDHIFAKGFEVIRSGAYEDASASDHIPVWTILRPRARSHAPSGEAPAERRPRLPVPAAALSARARAAAPVFPSSRCG